MKQFKLYFNDHHPDRLVAELIVDGVTYLVREVHLQNVGECKTEYYGRDAPQPRFVLRGSCTEIIRMEYDPNIILLRGSI